LNAVLTRLTLGGSLYLVAICILPAVLFVMFSVPFQFGGTALLIVVGVALDTVVQVQQHLHLRHYDDFMKKGKVKFRGRKRYM
jgi:preprotein translocase subunit SecY